MRTVTIRQDSRFFVSTNCGSDGPSETTRLDLCIRVDREHDVHIAFLDPDALRVLGVAINSLLANYRRANPAGSSRRRRCPPSFASRPFDI